jgi:hypothetical protein
MHMVAATFMSRATVTTNIFSPFGQQKQVFVCIDANSTVRETMIAPTSVYPTPTAMPGFTIPVRPTLTLSVGATFAPPALTQVLLQAQALHPVLLQALRPAPVPALRLVMPLALHQALLQAFHPVLQKRWHTIIIGGRQALYSLESSAIWDVTIQEHDGKKGLAHSSNLELS